MRMLVVTGSFPAVTQTFVTREVEAASQQHEVHVLAARREPAAASLAPWLQQRLHVLDWRSAAPIPWPPLAWTPRVGRAARSKVFGRVLGLRRRRYFSQLLSIPSLGRIDLIHAHWTELAENVAVPLGELFDVPVTCTVHDSFLPDVSTDTLKDLQRTVDTIVMVSSWSLQHWAERTGSSDRLVLVPNGVDVPAELPTLRPDGVPVVVNVARCEAHKRQPDLLQAIAQLRRDRVDVRCVIVGAGPELANLQAIGARPGHQQRLRIHRGPAALGRARHDRQERYLRTSQRARVVRCCHGGGDGSRAASRGDEGRWQSGSRRGGRDRIPGSARGSFGDSQAAQGLVGQPRDAQGHGRCRATPGWRAVLIRPPHGLHARRLE